MDTPETVVNMASKSYFINSNIEQSALMNIINKLQTDLTEMKYMSRKQSESQQIISNEGQFSCIQSEMTQSISSGTSSYHSPKSMAQKAQLKKNYEEKVQNLIKIYEKKLEEYKEKLKYLEDDREAFVGALQAKHTIITTMKTQLRDLEVKQNQDLEEIQKAHEAELAKLQNKLSISETCYKDLEQVRQYLEKNNSAMRTEISDTQTESEQKILKIADEYELEKRKYKAEVNQIKKAIEVVEKQAEAQIEEMRRSLELAGSEYESEIERLKQEVLVLKQQQKAGEEERQKLEVEQRSYEDKLKHTKIYYEAKISSLSSSSMKDRENYLEDIEGVKEKFERQFKILEEDYVVLERDVEMKKKEYIESEMMKKQLVLDVADLRNELEETVRKNAEDYDLLKENSENMKKSYETENTRLQSLLMEKEKIADDLDIVCKKYEKQYNALKNSILTIKEEAEQDSTKMWEKLKNEKAFYHEEVSKLKAEYNARMQKQDEEISRLKQETNESIEKINQIESSKRSLEKSNRDLKSNQDLAINQYKDEINRLTKLMGARSLEYQQKIDELQSELAKTQKNIQKYEEVNQMLQSRVEEYKTVNAETASKYISEIGRLREELAMTRRFHADDLSSIQKQLELKTQIEKEKDERIQKLKIHITEIKSTHMTEVDEKLEKLEIVQKELETENTVLKHQLNDITEEFRIQKTNNENMQERIKRRYEDERDKLRDDNEKMVSTIDNLETMVADQERENKLLRKNLEDISKAQSDEAVELVENLALARQKFDEKVHKLKQEAEKTRRNYENDLEKARNEFQADRQLYEEKIQDLKSECSTRKIMYDELEAAKQEMEENWELVQKEEMKKLAFLGEMSKLKMMNN